MKRSTTSPSRWKKWISVFAVACFWLAVWQGIYTIVAQEILLVSPVQAVLRLFSLVQLPVFWQSVGQTCLRVMVGFLAAVLAGSLLAAASACCPVFRALTTPLMGIIRATPVASFILLALVWIATNRIPMFIAFLVVVPIVWQNLVAGLDSVDRDLLEMAAFFRFSRWKILRYIYLPAEMPHFVSACSTGLGLAWKSAVAAEVIALPKFAIGRQLNNAKIYLETADLFAWTMVVILLSLLIEQLTIRLLRKLTTQLSGQHGNGQEDSHANA